MAHKSNKFSEGEKILCFHGPLIYEGKCLKYRISPKDNQNEYWVHYAGWNKSWDEWVPEARILKYNDANLARKKDLLKSQSQSSGKKSRTPKVLKGVKTEGKTVDESPVQDPDSRSSTPNLDTKNKIKRKTDNMRDSPTPSQGSVSDAGKKKKPKLDLTVESEAEFMISKAEIKIKVPDELKPWYLDDWDLIYNQKKLVNLPAKPNVDTILDDYIKYKKSNKNTTPEMEVVYLEITKGIKDYFNVMLGSQLLLKFERPQYADMLEQFPEKQVSEIYGSHHLLRLFLKLGEALATTGTSFHEKSTHHLLTVVQDLFQYMLTNASTLFNVSNYGVAPPEYHRKTV